MSLTHTYSYMIATSIYKKKFVQPKSHVTYIGMGDLNCCCYEINLLYSCIIMPGCLHLNVFPHQVPMNVIIIKYYHH